MNSDCGVDKYLEIKKVAGIRTRTKMAEEAGERILRPMISDSVVFEEHNYFGGVNSFHDCDFIYSNAKNAEEISETAEENAKSDVLNFAKEQIQKTGKKPLMIYIHGGGWTVGSKEARRGMLSIIAQHGFFVVSMNYTLCPEAGQFEQIKEVFSCVDFAFSKADEYGFDKSRVYFCGDSAGGHIATLACVCKNNSEMREKVGYDFKNQYEIAGVAPICGVFNFQTVLSCKFPHMKKYVWAYGGKIKKFLKSERSFYESPVNFAKDFPPCFIIFGEKDKLKKQSEELIFALAKEGGKMQTYMGKGKGGFHVFPAMFTTEMAKESLAEMCCWLMSEM